MNTRLLGTIGMLASPFLLISGVVSGFDLSSPSRVTALLGLVFVVGWACSSVALRLLRATGSRAVGGWLLAFQGVGLLLAASQQLMDLAATPSITDSRFYNIADAAWPLSVLFMLVVGGFTAAAGVWTGWRRWTPLLCGFALPILMATMALAGLQIAAAVFGAYTTATWALLGHAVRTSEAAGTRA